MKTKTSIEKLINGTDKGDAEDGKWNIEGLKKVLSIARVRLWDANKPVSLLNIPKDCMSCLFMMTIDYHYHYQSATILRVVKHA